MNSRAVALRTDRVNERRSWPGRACSMGIASVSVPVDGLGRSRRRRVCLPSREVSRPDCYIARNGKLRFVCVHPGEGMRGGVRPVDGMPVRGSTEKSTPLSGGFIGTIIFRVWAIIMMNDVPSMVCSSESRSS
jgi:hypothetical protein